MAWTFYDASGRSLTSGNRGAAGAAIPWPGQDGDDAFSAPMPGPAGSGADGAAGTAGAPGITVPWPGQDGDDAFIFPGTANPRPFVGARGIMAATQTITVANGTTAIIFDGTDTFDTNSIHDPVTNNTRFLVPSDYAGYWRCHGQLEYDTSTHQNRVGMQVRKNGVATALINKRTVLHAVPGGAHGDADGILYLAAGDYVEFYATANDETVIFGATSAETFFEFYFLGA